MQNFNLPQVIMFILLIFHSCGYAKKLLANDKTDMNVVTSGVAVSLRFIIVFVVLHWGGFW
jgi:hypothetical protein